MKTALQDSILQAGAPLLRQKAASVAKKEIGSRAFKALLKNMSATLRPERNGVALAAPQIGSSLRVFIVAGRVFEPEGVKKEKRAALKDRVFINPEFVRMSRKKAPMSEGCLSVRHIYGTVVRHEKATIQALDGKGRSFIYHGSGLLAQIFQHEMDHLDGVLFTDKAEHLHKDEKEK